MRPYSRDDGYLSDGTPLPPEPPDEIGDHAPNGRHAVPGGVPATTDEPTTWEAVDLGPFLRGEVELPAPSVGMRRSDGLQLLYPGREHAIIGETESGKTWLALACVVAELLAGRSVVYIHFEESDPSSTIERLLRIGVTVETVQSFLRFVAPSRVLHHGWLDEHLAAAPSLVILDGANEGMTLLGLKVDMEGWSTFRRRVSKPFLEAGAAVATCDHVPINSDPSRRDAIGTVHKGNVIDGARIMLTNEQPFGRNMRGASHVFATKDRPGHLRAHGSPTKTPGITYLGTMVVDDTPTAGADFLTLWAPKDDVEKPAGLTITSAGLADAMYEVIASQPNCSVSSSRKLFAAMRAAGHRFSDTSYKQTVDDLIIAERVQEVSGKRGAVGYLAVVTASEEKTP